MFYERFSGFHQIFLIRRVVGSSPAAQVAALTPFRRAPVFFDFRDFLGLYLLFSFFRRSV